MVISLREKQVSKLLEGMKNPRLRDKWKEIFSALEDLKSSTSDLKSRVADLESRIKRLEAEV